MFKKFKNRSNTLKIEYKYLIKICSYNLFSYLNRFQKGQFKYSHQSVWKLYVKLLIELYSWSFNFETWTLSTIRSKALLRSGSNVLRRSSLQNVHHSIPFSWPFYGFSKVYLFETKNGTTTKRSLQRTNVISLRQRIIINEGRTHRGKYLPSPDVYPWHLNKRFCDL